MCRRGPHCPPLGRPHVSSRPITAGLWAVGTPLPFPLPQFSSALPVDPAPDCIRPRLPDPCTPATSWLSSSPPGLLSSSLRHPPRLQTAARVVFLQTPCDRVTPQGRSSMAPSWPEDEAQTQALGATVLPSTRTLRELELSRCLSLACRGLQSVLRAWCILRASEDGASAFWRQAQVTRHRRGARGCWRLLPKGPLPLVAGGAEKAVHPPTPGLRPCFSGPASHASRRRNARLCGSPCSCPSALCKLDG